MHHLRFENTPFENRLRLRELQVQFPASWQELEPRHLPAVANAIFSPTEPELRVNLLLALLDMQWYQVRRQFKLSILRDDELYALCKCVDWLLEENKLTRWLLPALKARGQVLYGPQDKISTSTFREFCDADTFYLRWWKTREPLFLRKMMAVLFRPAERPGYPDVRADYDPDLVNVREKLLEEVPEEMLQAMVVNWMGIRHHLTRIFRNVFPEEKKEEQEEAATASKAGWVDVITEMAREKVTDMEEVGKVRVYPALKWLDHQISTARERETAAENCYQREQRGLTPRGQ